MNDLINILHEKECSCVVRNEKETFCCFRRGVIDLYELLLLQPERLHNAKIADKVIGKGSAAILALGGITELYADVISVAALKMLDTAGIKVTFGESVDHIINRNKNGWCPVEALTRNEDSPKKIVELIGDFLSDNK